MIDYKERQHSFFVLFRFSDRTQHFRSISTCTNVFVYFPDASEPLLLYPTWLGGSPYETAIGNNKSVLAHHFCSRRRDNGWLLIMRQAASSSTAICHVIFKINLFHGICRPARPLHSPELFAYDSCLP